MKKIIHICSFCIFFLFAQVLLGQSKKEAAVAKAMEAIELMDKGELDESIKLLNEALKMDPNNYDISYEMAYAYVLKKDYAASVKIAEKNLNHKDATDQIYQLLGSTYDYMGKPEKAVATYQAGLKKFPKSGSLYLESGNMFLMKKEYNEALELYEKGIQVEPQYPSNYYRAALLYLSSSEEIWGMIYGEIFMNLERNTKRTAEISKLLYDTYKSEITYKGDSSASVSFCKQMNINIKDASDLKNIKLPFGMVYEGTYSVAVMSEKAIDLNSLDRLRTKFVESYYQMGHDKTHPNVLFDYQQEVLKAGHFEAYNHWLLMKGDEDAFDTWLKDNEDKFEAFAKWFNENGLKINGNHRFYRDQY